MGLLRRWRPLHMTIMLFFGYYMLKDISLSMDDKSQAYLNPRNDNIVFATLSNRDIVCGFQGNSDIYGMGIRIGIYLQWYATWFTNTFAPGEYNSATKANLVFLLAIFVSTSVLAADGSNSTHAIEIIILFYIFFASAFSTYHFRWMQRVVEAKMFGDEASIRVSLPAMASRGILFGGMSCVSVWFWWKGLHLFPPTKCGTYLFLFAKVNPYGKVRYFFRTTSVLMMYGNGMGTLFLLAAGLGSLIYVALGRSSMPMEDKDIGTTNPKEWLIKTAIGGNWDYDEEHKKIENRTHPYDLLFYRLLCKYVFPVHVCSPFFFNSNHDISFRVRKLTNGLRKLAPITASIDFIILSFSMVAIELMLRWNHITSVYDINTTGQIIPFVIGLGSICQVCYVTFIEPIKEEKVKKFVDDVFSLLQGPRNVNFHDKFP